MSAWGIKAFQNDYALEFLNEIEGRNDLSAVEEAISFSDNYIDADAASHALVGCEIIILLHNIDRNDIPDSLSAWILSIEEVNPKYLSFLLEKAKTAISKVFSADSELWMLWIESPHFFEWRAEIDNMIEVIDSQ
jgi:hypothetical protein